MVRIFEPRELIISPNPPDQARANRELADRHCDKGEARGEIVSGACNQPDSRSILPRQNAKAVML
jgi:hypothetical protein